MLERFREHLAFAISPSIAKARGDISPIQIISTHPANIPIYSEMTVYKATREGYKISIYVYRAIRTIIQAASAIPWIVLDKDKEPIEGHPLAMVLAHPNPEFSGQDLMEFLIAHLELVGNALWQPIVVRGQIKEIWPIMPDLVNPIPSDVPGEWLKGWQIHAKGGEIKIAPPEQFIHFMQVDPGNPYWGISPLMAAARTIDTDNEAQDTQKISMQNRGMTDGVFTHEAVLTQEQFEEARRQIRENFLAKSRRREPWVLGAGAKWNQMSLTPVEMDFIASRLANLRAIAAAFGIDPWWLGDRSASTYNNVMEARKALYEDVVIPLFDDIQSTINLKIAPLYGDITVAYNLSGIPALREDFGKKVEQARSLWSMGVPFDQINTRLDMGFEEFVGWGRGYLPMNLIPTGSSPAEPEAEVEEEEGKSLYKYLCQSHFLESEEAKKTYWKAIDRRRVGWWRVAFRRIEPLYKQEMKVVAKAFIEDEDSIGKAIRGLVPKWEEMMTAILLSVVEDFGSGIAEDLGAQTKSRELKWLFDPFSNAVMTWIAKHGAEVIKTILATNLDEVREVILRGKEENLTTPQITQKIKDFYEDRSAYKAMRVARTEVSAAAGFGQREAAKQSGIVKTKVWISSRDDRVRDSHKEMDGEERQLDEQYSNGLMYPGDPSGDPSESIQCRCVETYHTER